MSTISNILTAARAYVATLAPSRSSSLLFKEHTTNQPFEKSPISMTDGFEITAINSVLGQETGVTGLKRGHFTLVLKLGHADAAPDKTRENYVASDIARLTDLIEMYTWPTIAVPDLVDAVFALESADTNKDSANWWITTLRFDVRYAGVIETQ